MAWGTVGAAPHLIVTHAAAVTAACGCISVAGSCSTTATCMRLGDVLVAVRGSPVQLVAVAAAVAHDLSLALCLHDDGLVCLQSVLLCPDLTLQPVHLAAALRGLGTLPLGFTERAVRGKGKGVVEHIGVCVCVCVCGCLLTCVLR